MKNKTNLLPGSVIAVLLGVVLATPLLYSNSVIAPTTGTKIFDVDLPYVYLERRNTTVIGGPVSEPMTLDVPCTKSLFALNYTQISDNIPPCDALLEVYQIQIKSEKGLLDTIGKYQGIYEYLNITSDKIIKQFMGETPCTGFFGVAFSDWTVGKSKTDIFSYGTGDLWQADAEPETLTVSVQRLGWFIVTGDSSEAVVLSEPELVIEVQLEKYKEGLLYNSVIPEDQLDHIDLTNPFANFFELINNKSD
jgi:hypothetical protein